MRRTIHLKRRVDTYTHGRHTQTDTDIDIATDTDTQTHTDTHRHTVVRSLYAPMRKVEAKLVGPYAMSVPYTA
eukprot:3052503-Rhodomonas_salina.4